MTWICNIFTVTTLLLGSAVLQAVAQTQDKQCKGVYFSDKYYDIEIFKEGINNVHQILLNRHDNNLYFIFDQISSVPTRVLGYINIDTKRIGLIEGIRNASSIAIDQAYNRVYVGGSQGIFRINDQKLAVRIPVQDNIQSMYYKDVLFYTNNRNEAFMYDNGHINAVFELQGVAVNQIVLDDDHNIFFTQGKQLFRVRLGTRAVNTHEKYRTNVLATDPDERPYIVTNDGIYVYNKYKYVYDKVSDITSIKALSFTKRGEPIYAIADLFIKLRENPVKCFEPYV